MKINASEIRVGMLLEHTKMIYGKYLKTQHVKPGKGGSICSSRNEKCK